MCRDCRFVDNTDGTWAFIGCQPCGSDRGTGITVDGRRVQLTRNGGDYTYPLISGDMTHKGQPVFGTRAYYRARPEILTHGNLSPQLAASVAIAN